MHELCGIGLSQNVVRTGAHTLDSINNQERTVARQQGGGNLGTEIYVTRRIDKMDDDVLRVGLGIGTVPMAQADGGTSHGNTTLLFLLERIEVADGTSEAFRYDPIRLDEGIGQGRLAVVDVSDDGQEAGGRRWWKDHFFFTRRLTLELMSHSNSEEYFSMAVCTHEQLMWCVVVTVALFDTFSCALTCCQPTKKWTGGCKAAKLPYYVLTSPRWKNMKGTHSEHANEVW